MTFFLYAIDNQYNNGVSESRSTSLQGCLLNWVILIHDECNWILAYISTGMTVRHYEITQDCGGGSGRDCDTPFNARYVPAAYMVRTLTQRLLVSLHKVQLWFKASLGYLEGSRL